MLWIFEAEMSIPASFASWKKVAMVTPLPFAERHLSYCLSVSRKSGKTKSDTYQKRKAIFGAKTKSDENNKGDTRNSIAFIITLMMGYTFKSNFTFSSPANNCCVFPILFS